jgi:hypothetical protein
VLIHQSVRTAYVEQHKVASDKGVHEVWREAREGNGGEGRREGEGRRGEAEGRGQLPAWLDNDEGMAELLQVELHHLHLKIRLQKRLCKWSWQ